MIRRKNRSNISVIADKIQKLNLTCVRDLLKVRELSSLAFLEWKNIRNEFLMKLKLNTPLIYSFEAEEDVIIGLISLLYDNLFNYLAIEK